MAALSRSVQDCHPSSGGTGASPGPGSTALVYAEHGMSIDAPFIYWRDLRQLAELPGPEWRLPRQRQDELCLVRAFEHFVETICLIEGGLVAVNRSPIAGRSPRTIAIENVAGSFQDAVEFLQRPPRWEHGGWP